MIKYRIQSTIGAAALILGCAIGSLEAVAADPGTTAAAQTTTPATQPPTMADMHVRMQAMQAQMMQINKISDAAERQKLMQAHMANMSQMMQSLGQMCATRTSDGGCMMGGPMMAGPGMMNGGTMQGGMMQQGAPTNSKIAPAPAGDTASRLAAIERRLDLMTEMLDQMIQHQGAATSPPKK